jgi:hypothetical protein
MTDQTPSASNPRLALPDLSLPVRLVLSVFLLSVGLGFMSALVNVKFQDANAGDPLPTTEDVVRKYHAGKGVSQLERLLVTSDTHPFNGQGSMWAAFTTRARIKPADLDKKATELNKKNPEHPLDLKNPTDKSKVKEEVLKDLDGERMALILWSRPHPTQQKEYEENSFELPDKYKDLPITPSYCEDVKAEEGKKEPKAVRQVKIQQILETRCVRCHDSTAAGRLGKLPLDNWDNLAPYLESEGPTGMSLNTLALTTHVHLLGFSVLYVFTGLILALSTYPVWMRVLFAPLALLAQVVEISFWWSARLVDGPPGEMFARLIPITGGLVAVALLLQIVLSLFNMYKTTGKLVLILLFAAALGGGYFARTAVVKYLEKEKGNSELRQEVQKNGSNNEKQRTG